MIDRGIIKWQPFDSCYSSNNILKDIYKQKNKHIFPILSEDQLLELEEKILNAYYLNEIISIRYFYNGSLHQINGKIKSINLQEKKIHINENNIYFKQIIQVI